MAIKGKTKNGTLSEQFHNTMEKSQLDFKNLTKFLVEIISHNKRKIEGINLQRFVLKLSLQD
jgi:hypothetical protein